MDKYNGFYIEKPMGNNIFSYDERENKKIYVPKLIEGTLDDVLVGEPSTDDVTSTLELYGKRVNYLLAIPKGDSHDWENTQVELPSPFSGIYNTIGVPTAGIESNIPLRWNKKVKIERYVQDEN